MHEEILNVDDDAWENSVERDVHPRTGLTSANITEGKNIEIEGLSMEFNVFVHQIRSEVLHLKKISATLEIQSKGSGTVKKARSRFVCREFRRGKPRFDLFAVSSFQPPRC